MSLNFTDIQFQFQQYLLEARGETTDAQLAARGWQVFQNTRRTAISPFSYGYSNVGGVAEAFELVANFPKARRFISPEELDAIKKNIAIIDVAVKKLVEARFAMVELVINPQTMKARDDYFSHSKAAENAERTIIEATPELLKYLTDSFMKYALRGSLLEESRKLCQGRESPGSIELVPPEDTNVIFVRVPDFAVK